MNKTGFMYVAPHIVGNAEKWGYCYDSDWEMFPTRLRAYRHGIRELDHDDFWVAKMKEGVCLELFSEEVKRGQEDVDDFNKELGN